MDTEAKHTRKGITGVLVATIPQIDGGVREVYGTASDRDAIRRDRAMVDGIAPTAIVDVDRDGTRRHVRCRCGATHAAP